MLRLFQTHFHHTTFRTILLLFDAVDEKKRHCEETVVNNLPSLEQKVPGFGIEKVGFQMQIPGFWCRNRGFFIPSDGGCGAPVVQPVDA
jgi:hypothetical protein